MQIERKKWNQGRFLYVYAFFVYMLLNQFSLYQRLPLIVNKLAFVVFAAWGGVLIGMDFFTRHRLFRVPFCTYLVLFTITCAISSLLNAKYGVSDNLKALVLTALHMFLLISLAADESREEMLKHIRILGETLVLTWLIGGLWSLWQFAIQYDVRFCGPDGDLVFMGYSDARLYGCFYDPNYASIISITAMAYAAWAFLRPGCRLSMRIYYGFFAFVQLLFLTLAYSRTGFFILATVGIVFPVLLFAVPRWKGRFSILKAAVTAAAIVASIALLSAASDLTREALSYVPMAFSHAETQQAEQSAVPEQNGEKTGKADIQRKDVESFLMSRTRFRIWSSALEIYKQKPVFGASPRNYLQVGEDLLGKDLHIVKFQNSIHNGFLAVLVCTGTVGAVLVLLWFISCAWVTVRYLIKYRSKADEDYWLAVMMTAVVFTMSAGCIPLMGIFFTNSVIEVIFWGSAGCLLQLVSDHDPQLQARKPLALRCTDWIFSRFSRKKSTDRP